MIIDLAGGHPSYPVGGRKEVTEKMTGTERAQTDTGTNTEPDQAMVGTQTLSERVLGDPVG